MYINVYIYIYIYGIFSFAAFHTGGRAWVGLETQRPTTTTHPPPLTTTHHLPTTHQTPHQNTNRKASKYQQNTNRIFRNRR